MRLVLVVPLKDFDQYVVDQPVWVYMTPGVAHLIVVNYLRLLWDTVWEVSDAGPS